MFSMIFISDRYQRVPECKTNIVLLKLQDEGMKSNMEIISK